MSTIPHRHGFTGRHMAAIMIGFFGVVIAVNLLMARLASSTFGGVVVDNSYVASQHFNRWLAAADSARALGWRVRAGRAAGNRVAVVLSGAPAGVALSAIARHPLGRLPDMPLQFVPDGHGGFISTTPLPAGRWRLRLEAGSGANRWRGEYDLP